VSNPTVALSDVNQNIAGGDRNGEVDNGLECRRHLIIFLNFLLPLLGCKLILA
jgi:hypothetical protein